MAGDFTQASGGVRVTVKGLSKTSRALSKAGADAKDMKDLMHRIGSLVVGAAQPPVKSGRLKASIRAGRGKTKSVVRAGGARIPYAGVIHYGGYHNISPHPFLVRAVQQERPAVLSTLDKGIDEILRKNGLK